MAETELPGPVRFAGQIRARVQPGPGGGVLWVHGYTLDSTVWRNLWSLLPDWSHYGIDLPGHGASPALERGTSLHQLGAHLADVCADAGIRHVVGLSVGSVIALEIATRRPTAFATLTLAAPAVAGGPYDRDVGLRHRQLSELYRQLGPGPWMTTLWMRRPPDTFAHATAELLNELATLVDRHPWSELKDPELGMTALIRHRQDLTEFVRSTARPLILLGQHELPAFRQTAAILRAVRPDCRVVELADAGHLCLLHDQTEGARLLSEHWRA